MQELFGKTGKLGFGLMRLPRLADDTIDVEQTAKMVDAFLEAGFTYFDTAYVYGGSEEATKKALVERHPRESYTLATKLNTNAGDCHSAEDAKQQLFGSLEKTGAGYFDFYLMHAMNAAKLVKYEEWGLWDFVKEQKEKGLIKHIGISFHDTPAVLEQYLERYPEIEFVQLQINYADWENPSVCSRECYELCVKYGKPVVVMEPVKGGTLANPPKKVAELFAEADPNASAASWAVRYVASLPGVYTVLSGMSNIEQMEDNLSYMKGFEKLTDEQQAVIAKAQEILDSIDSIPCTSCHYCTPGCPMQIKIPELFQAMNRKLIFEDEASAKRSYEMNTNGAAKASECIQCGQCEMQCPQHIQIIDKLQEVAAALE